MLISSNVTGLNRADTASTVGQSKTEQVLSRQFPGKGVTENKGLSLAHGHDKALKMTLDSLSKAFTEQGMPVKLASQSPIKQEKEEPLFDFEKVAQEVLSFVGKTIYGAENDGASEVKLQEMLSQAREGVALGFAQAKDELEQAELLDEQLTQGIDKSFELITKGIDDIENTLFGPKDDKDEVPSQE
jgi:hypothetical protein